MPDVRGSTLARWKLKGIEALPTDWRVIPIGSVTKRSQYGLSSSSTSSGTVPIIGMKDLNGGAVTVDPSVRVNIADDEFDRYCLKRGDVLFNRTNSPDLVGKAGIVEFESPAVFASYLVRLQLDEDQAVPAFVNYVLNSFNGQQRLRPLVTPGVSQSNINPTSFQREFLLPLPSISEQKRIVEILRAWDEAIKKTDKLIAAKQTHLKALRQKLLGHNGEFPDKWPSVPLSEIATQIKRKSDGGDHPVMTISGRSGYLRQDEKYGRFMAGRSLENYTLLRRGEFAYNKGNSKTFPQGCIYQLNLETSLVPHVYVAFRLSEQLNSDFYAHIFESGLLNRQLMRLINSGVRNDGLLNINAGAFLSCRLPVPPTGEQNRIAQLLDLAKRALVAIEEKNGTYRKQKRGLMQKLLTGEWRVQTND